MKITRRQLKELIQEELTAQLNEQEAVDLSKLEPTVEKAKNDVLNLAKGISEAEEVQRMVITALIAKLSELVK